MTRWRGGVLAAVAAMAVAGTAAAQTVVDGDTIRIAGMTYRLWGMDAPEKHQTCPDGWPAGRVATEYLARLIDGSKALICETRAKNPDGSAVALCWADGVDIEAAMVRAGMALAFVRADPDYLAEQAAAATEGLGMHAHECAKPWEWRARLSGAP